MSDSPPQIIVLPSEPGVIPPKKRISWARVFAVVLLIVFIAGEGVILWETWSEQQQLREDISLGRDRLDTLERELDATRETQSQSLQNLSSLQEGLAHAESLARESFDSASTQLQDLQDQLARLRTSAGSRTASLQQTREAMKNAVLPVACGSFIDGEFIIESTGSGTVLTPDGLLLTNHHVIETDDVPDPAPGTALYCAALNTSAGGSGKFYALVYLRGDVDQDVAIVQMVPTEDNQPAPTRLASLSGASIPLCRDEDIIVTKPIIVLGYPAYGVPDSVIPTTLTTTTGTVSQEEEDGYIATDAKIDHGNSGGAAFMEGDCFLGIPTAVSSKEHGLTESLGYILRIGSLTLP